MTQNSSEPREALTPGVRESNAAVADAIVPQGSDIAHEGDGLFPGGTSLPIARPVPVQTSGRLEFAARCPSCSSWHRHVGLGEKLAPCGTHYRLEFKTQLKGAA